jgi:hypothetical protein
MRGKKYRSRGRLQNIPGSPEMRVCRQTNRNAFILHMAAAWQTATASHSVLVY